MINFSRTFLKTAKSMGAVVMLCSAFSAQAELPVEQLSMEPMLPPNSERIYVSDPAMGHLVDGRVHIVDGKSMKYLGMLGMGFSGITTTTRDRQKVLVAATYYSRLQRGTRTDVVEVYDANNLNLLHEIEIPPKKVQALGIKALITTSVDDKFLYVQNATPAVSVSVIDLNAEKVTSEIPIPGCYGVIAWPKQPTKFSSVCGNGTLATFEIDADGKLKKKSVSAKFFDPDKDPIFMHYEFVGEVLHFVSYYGSIYTVDLSGDDPVFQSSWKFVDGNAVKKGWRPGGFQLFSIDTKTNRIYIGMHDHGQEGSHKTPAKAIWVLDLDTKRKIDELPGGNALSMSISNAEKSTLYVLDAVDNTIHSIDLSSKASSKKILKKSLPVGETPVFLGLQ